VSAKPIASSPPSTSASVIPLIKNLSDTIYVNLKIHSQLITSAIANRLCWCLRFLV